MGGPNRSSTFCPGGGLEVHDDLQRPAGDLRDGSLRAVREAVGGRDARERDPREPVSGRLHDDEVVAVEHGPARLCQTGRDGRDVTVRDPSYGAVVGVAHRDRPVGQRHHAERVLEQRVSGLAVLEAEVEQAGAHGGVHLAVLDVAHARRLAVRDPEPVVGRGEAGGLREPRVEQRAVEQPLVGGAGGDLGGTGARVEGPELVHARHRDPHPVVPPGHVPGAGERT